MSLHIAIVDDLRLVQLVGPGAAEVLQRAGLPCPDAEQQVLATPSGFVARTGRAAFLLADDGGTGLPDDGPFWAFPAADHVFRVTGAGWPGLMAELCALDPALLAEGGWLMTRFARIAVWLFRAPPAPGAAPPDLLIGCDPSHGRYLTTTLETVAASCAESRDN